MRSIGAGKRLAGVERRALRRWSALVAVGAIVALELVGVAPASRAIGIGNPTTGATGQVALISQNEELWVYDIDAGTLRPEPLVAASDFVNGPPCFIPDDAAGRFVEADDNPSDGPDHFDGDTSPFFGVFHKDGTRDFGAPYGTTQGRIGGALPDQPGHMEDPAGCAFDSAGNLFAVDVGNNHAPVIGDGQLIEFFRTGGYSTFCVLDSNLSQPGMVAFDADGRLYVPEAGSGKIDRFSGFPTSAADCHAPTKEIWATAATTGIGTPIGITPAPGGGWAVSSVLVPSGIFQVNDLGVNVGPIVAPGPDTGTPFGLAFDSAGDLFYADLGVRVGEDPAEVAEGGVPIDASSGQGAFRWKSGASVMPVSKPIATEWNFPDGVTVVPASSIAPSPPPHGECDWPTFGQNPARSFAAPDGCSTIDDVTTRTLAPKWSVNTDAPVTAQPAVVAGTLYVGSAKGTFYAVDADTGAVDWTFHVDDENQNDYGTIVSSATVTTVDGTRVVLFGGGSTLYALNAANGQELARSCFDPRTDPDVQCQGSNNTIEIESSPVVTKVDGVTRVLVGMDFNEDPNVGRAGLVGLDLTHSGSGWALTPKWKFDPETNETYTTDPLHEGDPGRGCGNVWSSPTIDPAANIAVFGVGNCDQLSTTEPGNAEAVVAVHIDSGTLAWRYEPRTPEAAQPLDLDFGATPNLLPGGLVGEGGKDGHYYALRRDNGTLGTTGFDAEVANASDLGGMIGSTALGRSKSRPAVFASSALPVSTRDFQGSMETIFSNPRQAGGLHAIDATTGEKLWDAAAPPAYGAAVYAGGVVFVPDTFGASVQAYDADTGQLLWAAPVSGAPSSPPAVVGDSIYLGGGTSMGGMPVLGDVGGIWAFETTTSQLP